MLSCTNQKYIFLIAIKKSSQKSCPMADELIFIEMTWRSCKGIKPQQLRGCDCHAERKRKKNLKTCLFLVSCSAVECSKKKKEAEEETCLHMLWCISWSFIIYGWRIRKLLHFRPRQQNTYNKKQKENKISVIKLESCFENLFQWFTFSKFATIIIIES